MKKKILFGFVAGLIWVASCGLCMTGLGKKGSGDGHWRTGSGEIELKSVNIDIALPMSESTLQVKAQIPARWLRNPDFGGVVFQPEDYADYFYAPLIQYQASCAGSCDPAAIPGNIEKAIQGIKDTLDRPNINTGNPELDAVRANVDIIADEQFSDGGWILAAAVTYPENLSSALYIPKIVVHSFRHHKGDGFFVQTTALAHLNQREELLPLFIKACKTTDY